MSDSSDITDAIVENAQGPKRSKHDQIEMEQHSLKDQILARDAVASAEAASQPHMGLRFSRLIPGPRT